MTSPDSERPTHTPTAVAATATAETSATPTVEFKLVGGGQVNPRVIQVAVNIVWLNAVEPLVFTGNHPVFHDQGQHIKAADVQLAFTFSAIQVIADDLFGELGCGRPPVLLPARVYVADHDATIFVQCRHRGCGVVEQVNVVHRNVK